MILTDDNGVWQVALNSNGTYTFTLLDNVSHPLAINPQLVGIQVFVRDNDGDQINTLITARIEDDRPVIGTITTDLEVDEDDLPDGTDTSKEPLSVTGNIPIAFGADGGTVSLATTIGGSTLDAGTQTLRENNGAWTLTINGDGTYTFTLLDNILLHGGQGDDVRSLQIQVRAEDGDGDVVGSSFNVRIVDDVPTANNVLASMSENETRTIDLVAGTDYSFGVDGAGTITRGTATLDSPVPITLDQSIISINGDGITITPGTTFDALARRPDRRPAYTLHRHRR